jgi:hypothetical protein
MKKMLNEGNQINNLYCVCENFFDSMLSQFRFRHTASTFQPLEVICLQVSPYCLIFGLEPLTLPE